MSIFTAVLLGFIQGVAEFLPISSSGHLSIFQNLFGMADYEHNHMLFDVLLHLGTLAAVCIVYRKDIGEMFSALVNFIKGGTKTLQDERHGPNSRFILMLVAATAPLLLVLLFNDAIESLYSNTFYIGIILIFTGVILYAADRLDPGVKNARTMRLRDAVIIGISQVVATLPGLSRSGTTISVGMATGLDRSFAVKFSFIMSIPAILAANLLTLFKALKTTVDLSLLPVYLVGVVVAGVVGFFAIRIIERVVQKGKFGCFAYYCWAVGLLTVLLTVIL